MKIILVLLLFATCLLTRAAASAPAVVVVLLPGTSLQDWQKADAPNLHHLVQAGALAVMNTRTAHQAGQKGLESPASVLLTLGAGSRAAGPPETVQFYEASTPASGTALSNRALFERRTGQVPGADSWVCPAWPEILQAGSSPGYDLRLGSLSDTLTAHGIKVVTGGGGTSDWIGAGNNGTVHRLGKLQAAPGCCVFWDAGSDAAAADRVVGQAAAQIAACQGRLIVLSAYPSSERFQRDERLTPILLWGQGVPAGLLYSPSTRRLGLVTDTDFAPAVAQQFSISRNEFRPLPFGFAWSAQAEPENVRTVETLDRDAVRQADGMRLLPYLAAAAGIWMLVVTLLMQKRGCPSFWAALPLPALTAALSAVSLTAFWIVLPGLIFLTWLLLRVVGTDRLLTIWLSAVAIALTVDMITGSRLMHRSLLGYSAIEGARYYGIGNEAMGLLLSSALVALSRLWFSDPRLRSLMVCFMVGLVPVLGFAGAKAGGVLVSAAVFGTYLYLVSGRRWTPRTLAGVVSILATGIALVAIGDTYLLPKAHSHIGEAIQRIATGGLHEASDIVGRKLAVDGRLAYHSAWALPLWAGIICTGALWKAHPGGLPVAALRSSGIAGAAACFLLNDAGVVAAAIFVIVLWCEAVTQNSSLPSREGRLQG